MYHSTSLEKICISETSYGTVQLSGYISRKTNKLFNGLEYVGTNIDDLLIISNKSFKDHIKKLDKVLSKLNQ